MATPTQIQNLMRGSTGSDVSQVQQALKQYGYYSGNIDGIFGPKTAQAVKEFQNATGIKVDSIVGPQTRGKLDEWKNSPINATANDPIIQELMKNDPVAARTIEGLAAEGGNRADMVAGQHNMNNKGYYFGPGVYVGPTEMQGWYDAAKKELDPEWNERLNYYKNDFSSGLEYEKQKYQSKLAGLEEQFPEDKLNLETKLGRQGNWDSSVANRQRTDLVNSSNREISSLQRDTAKSLSDVARSFENNFGTRDASSYDYGLPTGGVSWQGGYQSGGSANAYTPMGNTQGKLRQQYASQVEQYGKQKAGSAYDYPYIKTSGY